MRLSLPRAPRIRPNRRGNAEEEAGAARQSRGYGGPEGPSLCGEAGLGTDRGAPQRDIAQAQRVKAGLTQGM